MNNNQKRKTGGANEEQSRIKQETIKKTIIRSSIALKILAVSFSFSNRTRFSKRVLFSTGFHKCCLLNKILAVCIGK
jgi:hypothetical protein